MPRWFKKRGGQENFEHVLTQFAGKPFSYLEIGVFSGDSISWVAKNVLTHPESVAYGVDPWAPMKNRDAVNIEGVYQRARQATEEFAKVTLFRDYSFRFLRKCRKKFDVIYIDGDHYAPFVLEDSVLSWALLEPGGYMIWDDYNLKRKNKLVVDTAVQAFLSCFVEGDTYERVELPNDYQFCVRKIRDERSAQVNEEGERVRGAHL